MPGITLCVYDLIIHYNKHLKQIYYYPLLQVRKMKPCGQITVHTDTVRKGRAKTPPYLPGCVEQAHHQCSMWLCLCQRSEAVVHIVPVSGFLG